MLIHALGSDHTEWDAVCARLGSRHRILAVDLPGHGATPADDSVHVRTIADQLLRTLEERGVKRAVLVGHSYGGLVALALAAEHPERVEGVVVVDIPAYNPAGPARVAELDRILAERYSAFLDFLFQGMSADSAERARLLEQVHSVARPVLTAYFHSAWRADLRPEVARIRAPLLVVATEALWPRGAPWDSVAAHLGYARARRASGVRILSKHFVPIDAPDSLAADVERFSRSLH